MRHIIIIAIFCILITAQAQTDTPTPTPTSTPYTNQSNSDCGNGLPCGQIPWSLPSLPQLESPTPIPLIDNNISPPLVTDTPTPDFLTELTAIVDLSGQLDITGTPIAYEITEEAEYSVLAENSNLIFGYTKAIFSMDFGVLTPMFSFVSITMALTFLLKVSTYMLPVIGVIAGLIRKIIELIPGF